MALGLHGSAKEVLAVMEEGCFRDFPLEYADVHDTCLSSLEAEFYPPHQASSISVPRLQSNVGRSKNGHRHNYEFIKSRKTVNAGIRYMVQIRSMSTYFSPIWPFYNLASLCRFII